MVERTGAGRLGTEELMKILQAGQEKALDLNKKIIKMGAADKTLQNAAEGKGQLLDLTA
jgi:hypothetical protein